METTVFSPVARELIDPGRLPALGPGTPDESQRGRLAALTADELFGAAKMARPDFAAACRAGLWLLYDFLDESHAISQDIATAEGSYWHAIMHRREPDYSNAKYWFRRVGTHLIFAPLRARAVELTGQAGRPAGSAFLAGQSAWDPFAFIDLCESAARGRPACEPLCRQVPRAEWDLLFEYCYRRAVGKE
jgi:hypothetical protein